MGKQSTTRRIDEIVMGERHRHDLGDIDALAVTEEQITDWDLPTRPTKASDTRAKNFGTISVELDAIDPNTLRALVQETIERHLPRRQFEILKAAEQSDREIITRLVQRVAS